MRSFPIPLVAAADLVVAASASKRLQAFLDAQPVCTFCIRVTLIGF